MYTAAAPRPERRCPRSPAHPPAAPASTSGDARRTASDQRHGRARAGLVAPQHDRGHRHHDREGVEHQRQQRRVDAVERGEVAAGLGAVAHGSETQRQPTSRREIARSAAERARWPRRSSQDQRRRGRTGRTAASPRWRPAVGELAEYPHRAEGGGGGETEDGAGDGHGGRSCRRDASATTLIVDAIFSSVAYGCSICADFDCCTSCTSAARSPRWPMRCSSRPRRSRSSWRCWSARRACRCWSPRAAGCG